MKPVLTYEVSGDELRNLGCGVLVEAWDHKSYGKGKREWEKADFTLSDRQVAGKFYKLCYKWELRSGYPQKFRFKSLASYQLLKRLCNFFSTI